MPEAKRFPDTFLDYIPEPQMGREAYRQGLAHSFASGRAEVPPLYALLKVTNRCSSRCVYCGHAGVADPTDEADTALLKDVLDQLAEVGTVSVNLTGGEPLQRPDLPELVRHARSRGLFPILLTNGMFLRQRADELRGAGLGMVIVSLDSVRPEAYRATRGVPLGPVLDGLEALLAWPEDERPALTATVVITSGNVDHLDEIVVYLGGRGIGVKFTPYHHHGRWEDDRLSPQDQALYAKAMERLREMKRSDAGVVNSRAYLDNFLAFNFGDRPLPPGYACYCGYTTLYIDPQLNVRSCWSQGLPVAGSLREHHLADLLGHDRMRGMREKIRTLECERCWLLCTAEISLRFQP